MTDDGMIEPPAEFDGTADLVGRAPAESLIRDDDRPFEPWHRPRKQYIRDKQWASAVAKLAENRNTTEPVTYLGLPGSDLLDIRYLIRTVFEPAGQTLRFVGFNSGPLAEYALQSTAPLLGHETADLTQLSITSLDEILANDLVHERSTVEQDDIRRIGDPKSPAHQAARRVAPFDIVNLDLCTSLLTGEPARSSTYYAALQQLLVLQRGLQRPWLLFITTRVDSDAVDAAGWQSVRNAAAGALKRCPELIEMWEALAPETELGTVTQSACTPSEHAAIAVIGMVQWLCDMAAKPQIAHSARWLSSFEYRVAERDFDAAPDMVSIVLQFKPKSVLPVDDAGLAMPSLQASADPCSQSAAFLSRYARRRDVDLFLDDDRGQFQEMVEQSVTLLTEARYSGQRYREWVKATEPSGA